MTLPTNKRLTFFESVRTINDRELSFNPRSSIDIAAVSSYDRVATNRPYINCSNDSWYFLSRPFWGIGRVRNTNKRSANYVICQPWKSGLLAVRASILDLSRLGAEWKNWTRRPFRSPSVLQEKKWCCWLVGCLVLRIARLSCFCRWWQFNFQFLFVWQLLPVQNIYLMHEQLLYGKQFVLHETRC